MNLNPIVLSIPFFFILVGIALLVERFMQQKLYRLPIAKSNISCEVTSHFSGLFRNVFGIGIYHFVFEKFPFLTRDNSSWLYWFYSLPREHAPRQTL